MSDINQILQAAQILEKKIEREYKIIEGKLFCVIIIRAGKDQSYPIPMTEKNDVLKKLENDKVNLQKDLKNIELYIKQVKDIKC
jgi:hypothetical protein